MVEAGIAEASMTVVVAEAVVAAAEEEEAQATAEGAC